MHQLYVALSYDPTIQSSLAKHTRGLIWETRVVLIDSKEDVRDSQDCEVSFIQIEEDGADRKLKKVCVHKWWSMTSFSSESLNVMNQ